MVCKMKYNQTGKQLYSLNAFGMFVLNLLSPLVYVALMEWAPFLVTVHTHASEHACKQTEHNLFAACFAHFPC